MSAHERRELLLDTAVAVFGAPSSRAASLDAVARESGVAKPAIYELFPSRDALFEAAVGRELDRLVERLLSAYQTSEPRLSERTRARVAAGFAAAAEDPDRLRLLLVADRHPTPGIRALHDRAQARVVAALAAIIIDELEKLGVHAPAAAAQALALMVTELTLAAAVSAFDEETWDRDGIERLVSDFVAGGFAAITPAALHAVVRDGSPTG